MDATIVYINYRGYDRYSRYIASVAFAKFPDVVKKSAERLSTAVSKFVLNTPELDVCLATAAHPLGGSRALLDELFHEAGFIRIITRILKSAVDAFEDRQDGFMANEMGAFTIIMFHIEILKPFRGFSLQSRLVFSREYLKASEVRRSRQNVRYDIYYGIGRNTSRYLVYLGVVMAMQQNFNALNHTLIKGSALESAWKRLTALCEGRAILKTFQRIKLNTSCSKFDAKGIVKNYGGWQEENIQDFLLLIS
ncbi:hypothetical protein M422DRAFT_245658 [Sphaerobolus stellatus SS14]|nr:hypothetical protein M422DRAFT_245658 [Sphaerobolus stellatus SS14]